VTREQWTIFGVLAGLFALEVGINPATRLWLGNFGKSFGVIPLARGETRQQITQDQIALPVMWLVGVAVVMVLADYAPRVALGFVALVTVGVILMHGDTLANSLNNLQSTLGIAAGGPAVKSEPVAAGDNRTTGEPTAARQAR